MNFSNKSLLIGVAAGIVITIFASFIFSQFGSNAPNAKKVDVFGSEQKANAELRAHSGLFKRQIIQSGENIYTAVGYGLANSHMIVGSDGVIIVDAMTTIEEAQQVQSEFRKISELPIKALIYTHNHADHAFGGAGWVLGDDALVIAHVDFMKKIEHIIGIIQPAISARSTRMFGTLLPAGEDGVVNNGIGPYLGIDPDEDYHIGVKPPNMTIATPQFVTIADIELEIYPAPGETDDQINVWMPSARAVFVGDNVYQTFPNLYTIRGTTYRDVLKWSKSVDVALSKESEHLVPSHGRPVSGADDVAEILTAYRDAIKFVHDQTVRGINKGVAFDNIDEFVRLPDHLRDHPWLSEHYGRVAWSAKSIYTGYLGWFSGDATKLAPISPNDRATRLAQLAGGAQVLINEAKESLRQGDASWAAELAQYAERSATSSALISEAKTVRAQAFRVLAGRSENPNDRNYWLTSALELSGQVDASKAPPSQATIEMVKALPIETTLARLPVALDPVASVDVNTSLCLQFLDRQKSYRIEVHKGVAYLRDGFGLDQCDLVVETNSDAFIGLLAGSLSFKDLRFSESFSLKKGSTLALIGFLKLFSG